MKAHAIRIHERGDTDAMRYDEIDIPDQPGLGEVRIRNTAIGLNFIDPGHRSGLRTEGRYETPLPMTLGTEGAGVIEAVGPDTPGWAPGERVAYWYSPPGGAYCTHRNYPVARLVKLPPHITDEMGAALLCKGMTAHMLTTMCAPVGPGDRVLVHAAAGATGHLIAQWAKHRGALVIGTVSTDAKAAMALAHGCDHAIRYDREDFAARTREITGGQGVSVVYESVGADTILKSLDCLEFRGTCALFGLSSGRVDQFDTYHLSAKGCLWLTRPSVHQYHHTAELFLESAAAVFAMVGSGAVRVHIGQRYPLREVARAHDDLVGRKTIGATVLIP